MNRYFISILILSLAVLACRASAGQAVSPASTPSPTVSLVESPPSTLQPARTVCVQTLNVRSQPDPASPILGTLGSGAPVQMLARKTAPDGGTWVQLEFQGANGWVNARYLCEEQP